jgi:large subunit ribosomal protein L4e
MSARPQVSVQAAGNPDATASQLAMPEVFLAPIRPDIVQFVHTNMRKNARQAYSVKNMGGMKHSAHSWGTGRAVSRIPRVSGGGTSRAGQAAFGNMCRKGRMFAPTKIWRKWHRKVNTNQKRYAVASALAASALPALVMARGHHISGVTEVPCVVDNATESLQKTKQAIAALQAIGAYADVEKVKASRKLRAGKGKMRNRRHVQRLGPLVVYNVDNGIVQAFRNLPGVELAQVERLNLLQLAPGGHMGRFVIWTSGAFARLGDIWGSQDRASTQKTGYTLPYAPMTNSDLTRLINSDEVQSKVRPTKTKVVRAKHKKNPLKNFGVKVRLNPYALSLRRSELLSQQRAATNKAANVAAARKQQHSQKASQRNKNYNRINESGVVEVPVEEVAEEETATEEAAPAEAAPVAAKKGGKDY